MNHVLAICTVSSIGSILLSSWIISLLFYYSFLPQRCLVWHSIRHRQSCQPVQYLHHQVFSLVVQSFIIERFLYDALAGITAKMERVRMMCFFFIFKRKRRKCWTPLRTAPGPVLAFNLGRTTQQQQPQQQQSIRHCVCIGWILSPWRLDTALDGESTLSGGEKMYK